jgi:chloramphenicol 3-O-phosphotransferase
MNLVFIHGPAAAGKLTIARELATLSGLRLFHNHLVVDALLAVFPFGSDAFVRLREQMWLDVFTDAARQDLSLIFTFTPEPTVSTDFPEEVERLVETHDGRVHFVQLVCPEEEIERRIEDDSRAEFRKLRSLETWREIRKNEAGKPRPEPRADMTIDTSQWTPSESAGQIQRAFSLPIASGERFDPFAE